MAYSNQGRLQQQIDFLRIQFLQGGGLPFTDVLSEAMVKQALTAVGACWLDRIYSPLITTWLFLSQVLNEDQSCRKAVARLIAHRLSLRQRACSALTGAYCQARKRLSEKFFLEVARQTGQALDARANSDWLWKGLRVLIYDGSTVSMPDTPENQQAYPQVDTQKPGLGFPMARIAALFSLSCGAVVDLGICRYAGKGQSELGLLRTMWHNFHEGDILLADSLMCTWTEIATLKQRGSEYVCHLNSSNRSADFGCGKIISIDDHIVEWHKPQKPRTIDRETYNTLPDSLTIRECCFKIEQPGFRCKEIIIATTLLDADEYTVSDLAGLYRARWNAELDLRSLKIVMKMDVLRCKTPELVRKEIWTHILAYNLIRTIMAQAATKHDIKPRSISFKGTLQTLESFQPVIAIMGQHDPALCMHLYQNLLDCVASHRVANRPDRYEPRLRKRRPKQYGYLRKPRKQVKLDMAKGVTEN
jgi:IS4 transposase